MHAVVTKLTLGKPLDDELLRRMERDFFPRARESNPGFLDARVVRVSDTEAILLAFYATREALEEVSSKLATPWFTENVRPYVVGPVERSVGEVVARATP